ncbi:hypothetical protein FNU76_04250 [Chitinimonas arctica]|uniref:Uncharacterized protein n=1 Tax=Chitinimonas arctica TaxID=2594795 RepID=A0A516SC30_9NEIS|nr:hypothetical protein [Chitinimonas arctica]QDQ25628.1 hypothetical protein FNU76_04250 [Chitinimonas arctica]
MLLTTRKGGCLQARELGCHVRSEALCGSKCWPVPGLEGDPQPFALDAWSHRRFSPPLRLQCAAIFLESTLQSYSRILFYKGVELEVTYDYTPAEARSATYPGRAEEYLTTWVLAGDVNILPLLTERQILEIEQMLGLHEDEYDLRQAA